eukprot:6555329-Pyramimonas_sp.AAC.1
MANSRAQQRWQDGRGTPPQDRRGLEEEPRRSRQPHGHAAPRQTARAPGGGLKIILRHRDCGPRLGRPPTGPICRT